MRFYVLTTVTREQVLKALPTVATPHNKEFHTPELADALTKELGATIKSDTARYWANQLCLPPDPVLKRRPISSRLFVYSYTKEKAKSLSSSLTLKK
jgi:hypothetical protein